MNLPNEIILDIIDKIQSINSLNNFSRVNKRTYNLFKDNSTLVKKVKSAIILTYINSFEDYFNKSGIIDISNYFRCINVYYHPNLKRCIIKYNNESINIWHGDSIEVIIEIIDFFKLSNRKISKQNLYDFKFMQNYVAICLN